MRKRKLCSHRGSIVMSALRSARLSSLLGVPQDYQEAVKWYRLAADQGDADAQLLLALMYFSGKGVPKDNVLAHMWANLAASQGSDEDYLKKRDEIAKHMTPDQIAEAQRLAREWKPKGK